MSSLDDVRILFVIGSSECEIPEAMDELSRSKLDWIDRESITMVIAEFVMKLIVP